MQRVTCAAIAAGVLAVVPLTACTSDVTVAAHPTTSAGSAHATATPRMTGVDAPTLDVPGPSAGQLARMVFRPDPGNNGGWTSDSSPLRAAVAGQKYRLRAACISSLTPGTTLSPEPAPQASPKTSQVMVLRPDKSAPAGFKDVATLTVTCDTEEQLIPLTGLPAGSPDMMLGHVDDAVVRGYAIIERA